ASKRSPAPRRRPLRGGGGRPLARRPRGGAARAVADLAASPGDAWAAGRRSRRNQASKSLREIPRARGRTSDDAHSVRSATDELVPWVRAAHCVEQPIG
ncbi:unnamed protein product, partial [Prorocentrum cordatum]